MKKNTSTSADVDQAAAAAVVPPALKVSGTLKNPMNDDDVKVLQARLFQLGYYKGKIDGIFLEVTEAAVKRFQADQGLVSDGIAGAVTLGKLGIEMAVKNDNVVSLADLAKEKKGTNEFYEVAYRLLTYDNGYEDKIENAAKRAIANRARYEAAGKATGVPWDFIAGIHNMEASGNFAGVMHNGEKIIGTGKKTTLVPKGRGPFSTWEESCNDWIKLKGFDKITDWSIGNKMRLAELNNGTGYLEYHQQENSPYIFAMSNINDGTGKYLSDGKYSDAADANGQVGFATLLKEIAHQLGVVQAPATLPVDHQDLFSQIMAVSPRLNPKMVARALAHKDDGEIKNKDRILLVDFDQFDWQYRAYLLDMRTFTTKDYLVSQGTNSDKNKDQLPEQFSNVINSKESSLGAMKIGAMYASTKFKFARYIEGLEKGLNDNVLARAIRAHSSPYVNDLRAKNKTVGDSWGCFAFDETLCPTLMPLLNNILLYAYHNSLEKAA